MKNISQLKPTQRAIADQSIRDVLLAIVVAQGKAVRIPIADLNEIAANHRLILTHDPKEGVVILQSESFAAEIIKEAYPEPKKLDIYDGSGRIIPPVEFNRKPN